MLVACGLSGHGFKLTPVLGEVLADLASTGATSHDLSLFDPQRVVSPVAGDTRVTVVSGPRNLAALLGVCTSADVVQPRGAPCPAAR